MCEKGPKICRICLTELKIDAQFHFVNNNDEKMLESKLLDFMPEMDLSYTPFAITCNTCTDSILHIYEFKRLCLNTEETVRNLRLRDVPFINIFSVKMEDEDTKPLECWDFKIKEEMNIDSSLCIAEPSEEDFVDETEKASKDLLPIRSRSSYNKEYNVFLSWKSRNSVADVNEAIMLEYFQDLSKKYSPSSLSTKYSILKSTLIAKENINISGYARLVSFLKQQLKGYCPKKSKMLSERQVFTFIKEAPDESYLMHKVILIMGIFGALRRYEMVQMTIDNIEDKGSHILVKVPKTSTTESKSFFIVDEERMTALKYIRQYVALRPSKMAGSRFFLAYKNNRCTIQPVGKNTFSSVPSVIASYLKLDNPKEYTGHCLRRRLSLRF